VSLTIVRRDGGEPKEITAMESTSLQPGDVIKVTLTAPAQQSELSPATLGSIAAADGEIEGSSR
jgi:hypothetical protein